MKVVEMNRAVVELRKACAKIVWQNRRLLRRVTAVDFNAADELDCTSNGAQFYLTDFFDALALFEHGHVPVGICASTLTTTRALIEAICTRFARSPEIRRAAFEARRVFASAHRVWGHVNPVRRLPPAAFRQKLEDACDEFIVALNLLNRDLVEFADVPRQEKPRVRRPREVDSALTQEQVAEDFGVSRQTVYGWETSGKKNKYGYYAALRTDPARRGDYYALVNRVAAYNRWICREKAAGHRAAITFVAFNETVDSLALSKLA